MRIIFFTSKYNFTTGGGSTPEMDCKVRALIEAGHMVSVVTVFSAQNQSFSVPYPVLTENIGRPTLFNIQKNIWQFLKKYESQADAFEVEGQFAYGSGWYRLLSGKIPVLVHFNRELSSFPVTRGGRDSFTSFKHRVRFWVERVFGFWLINRNDAFTYTSPVLKQLYERLGLDAKKGTVMPDFFSTEEILAEAQEPIPNAESRGTPKNSWQVFATGRMVPEKGFDVLIKALAHMAVPNVHVTVSGDGPEMASLKNLAAELGVADKVSFPGWVSREEFIKLFLKSDTFVIPRWRPELTSMLTLQAMAFQVPLITTANTAIAWQAGDAAEMFVDEDPVDCARAIAEVLRNPDKRIAFAKKGRARLAELDYKAHYLH